MRSKLGTVLAFAAVIVLTSVTTATAGAVINGKDIKKGSIPLSAINKKAVKSLQSTGPQGPAGPPGASAVKYWAMIDENGTVVKQSGGITASHVTNGGATAKTRVTFPADVTNCFWSATNADPVNVLGANELVLPRLVSVGRSSLGGNVLEVAVWGDGDSGNPSGFTPFVFDTFGIAAVC
jgi:hypothetical protein